METISYPKEVKANKEHRCNFCGEKIKKGETYNKSTHVCDGDLYDWKSHKYCAELAVKMKMYDDCDEGVTEDYFQESISNLHFDLLTKRFAQDECKKYSDIIQQLRHVNFHYKLEYVLRYFAKQSK